MRAIPKTAARDDHARDLDPVFSVSLGSRVTFFEVPDMTDWIDFSAAQFCILEARETL